VVRQVLEGTLASDNGLDEETKHGEHGKTAVLDFFNLELSKCVRVVSKAQGVERTTGVETVETLRPFKVATVVAITFNSPHQNNLHDESSHNGVGVHQTIETEVLDTLVVEDLCSSLEPGNVSGVGGPFWHNAAKGTKHGPAGVDQLDLAVAGKGLGVGGETGGIPAVVTRELTLEVGHVGGEGAKELGAVGTIPADRSKMLNLKCLI
jgi:hypothetical protein